MIMSAFDYSLLGTKVLLDVIVSLGEKVSYVMGFY